MCLLFESGEKPSTDWTHASLIFFNRITAMIRICASVDPAVFAVVARRTLLIFYLSLLFTHRLLIFHFTTLSNRSKWTTLAALLFALFHVYFAEVVFDRGRWRWRWRYLDYWIQRSTRAFAKHFVFQKFSTFEFKRRKKLKCLIKFLI